MAILYLSLLCLFLVALLTILRKWFDSFILPTVAIGCAINANIFTGINHPIMVGPIIFGVDSVLYVLFIYAIILRYLFYGRKNAKLLTLSSIAAIILSAFIEFIALGLDGGFTLELVKSFSLYLFSVLGTFVGVVLMILFMDKFANIKKNSHVAVIIGMLVCTMANSLIYYAGYALVFGHLTDSFGYLLLGNVIGKLIAVIICEFGLLANNTFWTVR